MKTILERITETDIKITYNAAEITQKIIDGADVTDEIIQRLVSFIKKSDLKTNKAAQILIEIEIVNKAMKLDEQKQREIEKASSKTEPKIEFEEETFCDETILEDFISNPISNHRTFPPQHLNTSEEEEVRAPIPEQIDTLYSANDDSLDNMLNQDADLAAFLFSKEQPRGYMSRINQIQETLLDLYAIQNSGNLDQKEQNIIEMEIMILETELAGLT
jgi:hypothetical protein